jgi:hypothetical protein
MTDTADITELVKAEGRTSPAARTEMRIKILSKLMLGRTKMEMAELLLMNPMILREKKGVGRNPLLLLQDPLLVVGISAMMK